jgi:hypothetical protein
MEYRIQESEVRRPKSEDRSQKSEVGRTRNAEQETVAVAVAVAVAAAVDQTLNFEP